MFTNRQAYEGVDCKQEANSWIKTSFMRNERLKDQKHERSKTDQDNNKTYGIVDKVISTHL